MNNAQLSLLIETYCDLLCDAVDSVQSALPDKLQVTENVKPIFGVPYQRITYPCLTPLDELIARMKDHVQVLRETKIIELPGKGVGSDLVLGAC